LREDEVLCAKVGGASRARITRKMGTTLCIRRR
jgi:hypothetical protein